MASRRFGSRGQLAGTLRSGTWFFLVAAEGGDRFAQLLGALLVAAGEGHRQGEFKLFELMFAFSRARGRSMARAAMAGHTSHRQVGEPT